MEESMKTKNLYREMISIELIITMTLLGLFALPPQRVKAGGPYTVNVNYDGPDSNLNDGVCWDGVGGCTLRAAIEQASFDGVATTITFDSSLSGIFLYLSDSYGSLIVSGSNITIDGNTGAGNYPPLIDGSNLTGSKNIFEIQGNNNILENLVIREGPSNGVRITDPSGSGFGSHNTLNNLIIYGNDANGIYLAGDAGGGGSENTIQYCLIGAANWAQTTCPGDGNGWDGIFIANGADNTHVDRNEIVCNGGYGVNLFGSGISYTTIQTNEIGTDGTNDMGNGLAGIYDQQASSTSIAGNVISGNGQHGIWLYGSINALVSSNKIGVDTTGSLALPNGDSNLYNGIEISYYAHGNSIGLPTDAGSRNIISGNTGCGVNIVTGAYDNALDGNYIGLGTDGLAVIPNGLAGVCIIGAGSNSIGTSAATVNQYISGNSREGIYVTNTSGSNINVSTLIGVAVGGVIPAGNQLEGVKLDGLSTNSSVNSSKIQNNGLAGIAVVGNDSTGNNFNVGKIVNNGGLPIDLGNDGHTANGSQTPPGPNNWMNYPEVNFQAPGGFSGSTCPGCIVIFYGVSSDPTANYGGGNKTSLITADATTGFFNYTFSPYYSEVSMVACAPVTYDCSEMSPGVVDSSPPLTLIYIPLIKKP
jgi:parallel beta-helix repeat protein